MQPDKRNNATIRLHSGNMFNILKPDPAMILIQDIAAALSKLCRYTGHVNKFYSVAEHSFWCVELAKYHGEDDITLLRQLHLHDAAETYMNDLNAPLKHSYVGDSYHGVEDNLQQVIFAKFDLPVIMLDQVHHYDQMLGRMERDFLFSPDPGVETSWRDAERAFLRQYLELFPRFS